tara:strand:+ start:177 stop:383 length:207 start_codon:yes stop_codon:yes gene_type:complete
MLEGICGGDTKKGTWSLDEDGVTIRIDGKVFQFDCGASTITSEEGDGLPSLPLLKLLAKDGIKTTTRE